MRFFNIKGLKKYFGLGADTLGIAKKDLLTDTEALRAFGTLWQDHKTDVMTMLTVIEYEFLQEENYNRKESEVLRKTLGRVALFLKDCDKEYVEMKAKQKRD